MHCVTANNMIEFKTSGKAGEIKTIAHTPAERLGDGVAAICGEEFTGDRT